jgi:membrane glycosyltransferase
MLFIPPFASLLIRPRALFGRATVAGIARHVLAIAVASAYSVLFSPIIATFHVWSIVRVVWASIFGKSSSWVAWTSQNRSSHVIGLRESVRLSILPTLSGAVLMSGLVTSNVLSSDSIPVNMNIFLGLTCGTVMLSSVVIHFSSQGLGRVHDWLYDNACIKTPPFKLCRGENAQVIHEKCPQDP